MQTAFQDELNKLAAAVRHTLVAAGYAHPLLKLSYNGSGWDFSLLATFPNRPGLRRVLIAEGETTTIDGLLRLVAERVQIYQSQAA